MPWKYTAHNGQEYLVTDRWSLTRAVDRRNMDAEVRDLDGRHPRDIFGEDVPLGEIHFTVWRPDTCECVVRHLCRKDEGAVPVAHRTLRKCSAHEHHDNHATHFAVLMAENNHKNITVHEHAVQYGIVDKDGEAASNEIQFQFDADRNLVISHPVFGEKTVPLPH